MTLKKNFMTLKKELPNFDYFFILFVENNAVLCDRSK
jgi:hypothetical protein